MRTKIMWKSKAFVYLRSKDRRSANAQLKKIEREINRKFDVDFRFESLREV